MVKVSDSEGHWIDHWISVSRKDSISQISRISWRRCLKWFCYSSEIPFVCVSEFFFKMNLFLISISACSKNLKMFEKGILIIRNPLDCFIAEYNRVLQNNFEYAPLRKWNEIENVDDFFYNYMFPKWMELHNNIIKNFKNPLHVVEYESLKKDPIRTLFKILVFLNIEMTEGMRKCLSVGHDGPFRRPKRPQEEIDAILAKFSKENINIYERSYVDIMTKLFSLDSVSSSTLN